jgi:hypothetical protein
VQVILLCEFSRFSPAKQRAPYENFFQKNEIFSKSNQNGFVSRIGSPIHIAHSPNCIYHIDLL